MTLRKLAHSGPIVALTALLLAITASAANITYNTNTPGTGFSNGTSLILNNASGVAATLTFIPLASTTGVPSGVSLGNFTLVCTTCTTLSGGTGSFFNAFTFDLVITDVSDGGATGRFVGTSTGGNVFSDVSQIAVNWAPLQLGPGTNNALTGNFGTTLFTTTVFTQIVAPNSGTVPGRSTIQGFISSTEVPEPLSVTLIGGGLIFLGLLRRKISGK